MKDSAVGALVGECLYTGKLIDCSVGTVEYPVSIVTKYGSDNACTKIGGLVGRVQGSETYDTIAEVRFTSANESKIYVTLNVEDENLNSGVYGPLTVGGVVGLMYKKSAFTVEENASLTVACVMQFQKETATDRYAGVLIGQLDGGSSEAKRAASSALTLTGTGCDQLYCNEYGTASGFDDVTVTDPTAGS